MRLLKIEPAANKSDRFILRFEDETSLVCGLGEISDYCLHSDMELEPETYKSLYEACQYYKAKEKAAQLLSARPLSSGELRQKLTEKGISPEHSEKAVAWLEGLGLVNDAEYALLVVRHYAAKGYGTARIKNELYRHRVPKSLWEEALEQMPDNGDRVQRFINSRLKGAKPDDRERKKLAEALLRRGFSWDEIKSAISQYEENAENTEEFER
jgi:regulatory protein